MTRRIIIYAIITFAFLLLPSFVDAASLYASPSSGTYTIGDSFSVTIGVNTAGVAINSAMATVSFSNDLMDVTGVSQSGIFSLWPVSPSYSNGSGTVTFAGGAPNPGFNGAAGTIITITFQVKAAGTATASIGSASVLANDGFGTDVLTSSGSGSYTISAEPEPEPEPELDLPGILTIISSTHPEQSLWYADSNPSFNWNKDDGVVGFSYTFDDQPATTPDRIRDGTGSSIDYTGTGDGVWYFHARAQNLDGWGPVSHFTVQIDTTPPLPFNIDLLDGKKTSVTSPRVSFETTDETSGIHHYDFITDNGTALGLDVGATTPYTFSELSLGKHTIVAKAYDWASNYAEASESFTITAPGVEPPVVIIDEVEGEEEVKIEPLAEKIVKRINDILPDPIKEIFQNIGDLVNKIKQNEAVIKIVDALIQPIVTVTALVTITGLIVATVPLQLYNLFYLFFRWGYFWVAPTNLGKKRKSWGIVFDSITGKPVPRVVVRIFSREFNKLKESQITDSQGRFGFIVDKGQYYITAMATGFVFPSHILKTSAISQYEEIYRGDTLEVKRKEEGILSMNIPIDPNMKQVSQARLAWLRIINYLGYIIEKISTPLLVGGTILSWATLILDDSLLNYFLLSLYGFMIILKYYVTRTMGRSFGIVKDKDTKKPIEQAIIRIYNAESSNIVWTKVTNANGQYNALLSPGTYYLVIVKSGYESFQSKVIEVTKRRGFIRLTAELKSKVNELEPPASKFENEDQDIHLEADTIEYTKNKEQRKDAPKTKKLSKKPAVKKTKTVSRGAKPSDPPNLSDLSNLADDKDPDD